MSPISSGSEGSDVTHSVTFDQISDLMDRFVSTRGWYKPSSDKPQTGRNLAISLSIEAAELLECYQWNDRPDEERVSDELADVVLYAIQLARIENIDLGEAILSKLNANEKRCWPTPNKQVMR